MTRKEAWLGVLACDPETAWYPALGELLYHGRNAELLIAAANAAAKAGAFDRVLSVHVGRDTLMDVGARCDLVPVGMWEAAIRADRRDWIQALERCPHIPRELNRLLESRSQPPD